MNQQQLNYTTKRKASNNIGSDALNIHKQKQQQRHYSRSPIMPHNNGVNFQQQMYDQTQLQRPQSYKQPQYQQQMVNIQQSYYPPTAGPKDLSQTIYHKRSMSPTIIQTGIMPMQQQYYSANNQQTYIPIQNINPLTQSYNQPLFQNQFFEESDAMYTQYQNQQQPIYLQQNQIQQQRYQNRRVAQSVDFNTQGGFPKQVLQDNYIQQEMLQSNIKSGENSGTFKQHRRNPSPIWGPNLQQTQNMRDNRDVYLQQPLDINEEQYDPDILVTESDVSHQSSFYEIPQERKQKYQAIQPPYQTTRQIENEKQANPFNFLLKQFQNNQQQQQPQPYVIQQSQTAKVSPRFNLYQNQQQNQISLIQQQQQPSKMKSQQSNVSQQKQKDNGQQKPATVNYSRYQVIPIQSSKQTQSQQSIEGGDSQNYTEKSQKSLKSNEDMQTQQKQNDQPLTSRNIVVLNSNETKTENGKHIYCNNETVDTIILQTTVQKLSVDNYKIQTELEAFKILYRSLLKQNKQLKVMKNDQVKAQYEKQLYLAKIKQLEFENASLKIQNYKLYDKFQSTLSVLQEYANNQIEEVDEDSDYKIIEEIYEENTKLRSLLQISADFDHISQIQDSLKSEEDQLNDIKYNEDLQSTLTSLESQNNVKDLIEKASKEIKDKAKKRKEEEKVYEIYSVQEQVKDQKNCQNNQLLKKQLMKGLKANQQQDEVSTDGKVDKFAYKNIKPKKAFLLGSPGGNDEGSSDEQADGNVNMSSPDQQQIQQ